MKVLDPGHDYALERLDDSGYNRLTFVKREGLGYPGNVGHYGGTNIQEVLRALIDRVHYLDKQIPDPRNIRVVGRLRQALYFLEERAAGRRDPGKHPRAYALDDKKYGMDPKTGAIWRRPGT